VNQPKFESAPRRLQTAALVVANLSSFLTPFMSSAINVAMPSIAREFSLSAVRLTWVATAYMLTAAMFLVPFGRIGDIVGRKRIFALGLVVNTAGTVLAALSGSGLLLIVCRGLQGLGGAMIFGTGVAILTSVFPPGERGRALGINTAATYLGLSLGPVLGGVLVQSLGWRSIFWVTVPVGLAALAFVGWKLEGEWAEARGEGFDWPGAAVFGLGLVSLMYGFSRLPSTPGLIMTLAGLAALAGFAGLESRAQAPVLDTRLFRHNRIFAFSNLAALISYSATSAVTLLLSLYLQYIKALTPREAGFVLLAQPILMALCSPLAGKLSDRAEPRTIASAGMGACCAGLALFAFLRPQTTILFVIGGLVCLGIGFGLFSSPNTNAIMGSVERRLFGAASATLGTMRLTGQMMSAGITMMIFALIMGRTEIGPEVFPQFLRSVRIAFSLYAVLCFAGVFASLARGRRGRRA
jgi:EmrB/QacA subfamily drug resistance transporter